MSASRKCRMLVSGICRDLAYIIYKFLLHKSRLRDEHEEEAMNWREEERKNGPDEREAKLEDKTLFICRCLPPNRT